MSNSILPPELIISLSRDKVRFELSGDEATGRRPWEASYPVEGLFMETAIAAVMDQALIANEALLGHFDRVEIIMVDQPSICLPKFYAKNGQLSALTHRYLRDNKGETLVNETASADIINAYYLPSDTLSLIREYYANVFQVHLISVLWSAISAHLTAIPHLSGNRVFYFCTGSTLIILAEREGNLTFSKCFYVRQQEDVSYYALACSRMLQSTENWLVTSINQESASGVEEGPFFKIHHQLNLPETPTLIAQLRACES